MFLDYYGFREQPFGVTPDPRFLYFGPTHREALASLLCAIETKRGFSAMVAEPGMGKTSLLFHLLESLRGSARTAFVFQTDGESKELLRGLLADLGIKTRGKGIAAMHNDLNNALVEEMRAGRKTVVIIDEAQNLDESALESVRLLSNFETANEKLMHIVLAGQPKLAEKLASRDLLQLRQRVSTLIRLEPFQPEETAEYIQHRLRAAGYQGPAIFSPEALELIANVSKGLPRNISSMCFQALSIGFAMQVKTIGPEILREVIADLDFTSKPKPKLPVAGQSAAFTQPVAAPSGGSWRGKWPARLHAASNSAQRLLDYESSILARRRGGTGVSLMASILLVLIVSAGLVVFSDPASKLSSTSAGQFSTRIVNAILSSRDPESDFLPPQPGALKPPSPPELKPTSDETAADQPAASTNDAQPTTEAEHNDADNTESNRQPTPAAALNSAANGEKTIAAHYGYAAPQHVEEYQYRGPSSVQIPRKENLFQFALERFGKSNWTIVEEICKANPQIRGPYDILSRGQRVRIPANIDISASSNRDTR